MHYYPFKHFKCPTKTNPNNYVMNKLIFVIIEYDIIFNERFKQKWFSRNKYTYMNWHKVIFKNVFRKYIKLNSIYLYL